MCILELINYVIQDVLFIYVKKKKVLLKFPGSLAYLSATDISAKMLPETLHECSEFLRSCSRTTQMTVLILKKHNTEIMNCTQKS